MRTSGSSSLLHTSDATCTTGPLTSPAHKLSFDIHKATIRLWATTVRGSAAGDAPPKAAFRSVTVNLVRENNDWKLSGSSAGNGLVAPIDVRQATNVTSDFADYVQDEAADAVLSGATGADGFPAPYERTEQGAHAAATSAVMLWGDPRFFTNTDWRHRMLAATAAPSAISVSAC